MNKYEKLVSEFNKRMGMKVPTLPTEPTEKMKALKFRLIEEERDETLKAIEENNEIEIADGLCDLQYVISGAGLEWGKPVPLVDKEQVFCDIKEATGDGKETPSLSESVLRRWNELVKNDGIKETIRQFHTFAKTFEEIAYLQHDMTSIIATYGQEKFDALFNEVHRSNMTKACTTPQEARATIAHYKERYAKDGTKAEDGTLYRFEIRVTGPDSFVVYRNDGKILKSINYSPANFGPILEEFKA